MHLEEAFGDHKLDDVSSDAIEGDLPYRLRQRVRRMTKAEVVERECSNRPRFIRSCEYFDESWTSRCAKSCCRPIGVGGVEFRVAVKGCSVSWSVQQRMEAAAPSHLRKVVRITETGLRIYKKLAPMKKEHVDLKSKVVWIPDSTPNGIADVPLTDLAVEASPSEGKVLRHPRSALDLGDT